MRGLALAMALLIAGTAEARGFHAIGAGTASCGKWQADRHIAGSSDALSEMNWVVGFLSGIGFYATNGDDPLDGTDAQGVWAWIDNYCHTHPIEPIETAVVEFYNFHPHR